MTQFIDSTNLIGKSQSGWNTLGLLDGFSATGKLFWIYEWEAAQKDVGSGSGVVDRPNLERIKAYTDRVTSEFCVIDIESKAAEFRLVPHLAPQYLRASEIANPNTTWIWYNTHEWPPTWPVTRKPTTSELSAWWKQWDNNRHFYDAFTAGLVSFYPDSIDYVSNVMPYMIQAFSRQFGSRPKIWNMAVQTFVGDDATSPIKDLALLDAELSLLRTSIDDGLLDYVSIWGLFNASLPRLDISLEAELIELLHQYV